MPRIAASPLRSPLRKALFCGAVLLATSFVADGAALAGPPAEPVAVSRLVAPGTVAGDGFGESVAASGGVVVVGAPRHDLGATDTGAAYVFVACHDFLPLGATLRASDPQAGARFGAAVAIAGNTIAVGAPGASGGGAVYVFERVRGEWSQPVKLAGPAANSGFGTALAIDGDTLVVGAPWRTSATGQPSGSVVVFTRDGTTWVQQQEIASAYSGGSFGTSVAVRGDRLVAGAPDALDARGAAVVHARTDGVWSEEARLIPADSGVNDRTGSAVAIDGDRIAVGARTAYVETVGAQVGAVHVFAPIAGVWQRTARLTAPVPVAYEDFGASVALDGGTLAVGARLRTGSFADQGGVDVFHVGRSGWTHLASATSPAPGTYDTLGSSVALADGRLVSGAAGHSASAGLALVQRVAPVQRVSGSESAEFESFGSSVAVSGDTALIGAPGSIQGTGAVYVFERSGGVWSERATLRASDGAQRDFFGSAVALAGDTALVSARSRRASRGAVYAFERSGSDWTERQILTASDGAPDDSFGTGLAFAGDTALVGAPGASNSPGAAYVFERADGAWKQGQRLSAADGSNGDAFGTAVALSGGTALVGAPFDDGSRGSAYAFERTGATWTPVQSGAPPSAQAGDQFGRTLAVSGDVALAGAPGADSFRGAVYVLARADGQWIDRQRLTAANGMANDEFGSSVALAPEAAVVGAQGAASYRGAAYAFARTGDTWSERQTIVPVGGAAFDSFGASVALSDGTALVGAPDSALASATFRHLELGAWRHAAQLNPSDPLGDELRGGWVAISGDTALVSGDSYAFGSNAGAAYVFVRSGGAWSEQQRLTRASGLPIDEFGLPVALSGDVAAVSARRENIDGTGVDGSGAVHMFLRASGVWQEIAILTASDGQAGDQFGSSLAFDRSTIVIGAPGADSSRGAAYVFERDGVQGQWTQQARLTAQDGQTADAFGAAVALSGLTALVGATEHGGAGAGYVFVHEAGAWSQQQKLVGEFGQPGDRFGAAVALDGDLALLGVPGSDVLGADSGQVEAFRRSDQFWQFSWQLLADGGSARDMFGSSVALEDGVAVVGAPRDSDNSSRAGAAFVFVNAGGLPWTQQVKLLHPDGELGAEFGRSVAVSNGTALVGAWLDGLDGLPLLSAGSVHAFDVPAPPTFAVSVSAPERWAAGTLFSGLATATGGTPPYQWRVAEGRLQDGLGIDARTGALSGTTDEIDAAWATIECIDACGATASAYMELVISSGAHVVTRAVPVALVGAEYRFQVVGGGGVDGFTFTLDDGGSGLTVGAADGVLLGTPQQVGTFTLTLGGYDGIGTPATPVAVLLRVVERLDATKGKARYGVSADGGPAERALDLLAGSTLNVSARSRSKQFAPAIVLIDPQGEDVPLGGAVRSGRGSAKLKRLVVQTTGRYLLRIVPGDADPLAPVTVSVSVKPLRRIAESATISDESGARVLFGALAGSRVTFTAKAVRGSPVDPYVVVAFDGGSELPVTPNESPGKVSFTIEVARGGDVFVDVASRGAEAGGVDLKVVIRPPKGYSFEVPPPSSPDRGK